MVRLAAVILLCCACDASTPCPAGLRLAKNDRGGAVIQYCVRKDDGRAQGRYSCELHQGRGSVVGTFDVNFKHGQWQYFRGKQLIRTESWHNDQLRGVTRHGEAGPEPLTCDGHAIAPHPEESQPPQPTTP